VGRKIKRGQQTQEGPGMIYRDGRERHTKPAKEMAKEAYNRNQGMARNEA
jgi:hypothetical protein